MGSIAKNRYLTLMTHNLPALLLFSNKTNYHYNELWQGKNLFPLWSTQEHSSRITTVQTHCATFNYFTSLSWGLWWKMKLSEAVIVLIHPLIVIKIAFVLRSGVTQTLRQCCHLINTNIEENRSYSKWSWWWRKHRIHCIWHGKKNTQSWTWANNARNRWLLWCRWCRGSVKSAAQLTIHKMVIFEIWGSHGSKHGITIFWYVTTCTLVHGYWHFR